MSSKDKYVEGEEMNSTFEILVDMIKGENVYSKISKEFKIAVVSTFVIGLIAHMFIFTNPIFEHDAIHMYWPKSNFIEAAGSGRWLVPFWQGLLDNIFQPWLSGMLTLLFYSVASHIICKCFEITRPISIIMISGLLVTSPTAISSNLYLSSSYIYGAALLLSVLAVYYYENVKSGVFMAFILFFLCGSTYTAYISFGVSLFICSCILKLVKGKYSDFKKVFVYQIIFYLTTVASLFLNVVILTTWGKQEVIRGVELSPGSSLTNTIASYAYSTVKTYNRTIKYFWPSNNLSYFQEQKLLYIIFCLSIISTIFICIWLARKSNIKKCSIAMLMIDIVILPIAMDILGVLYESHLLMQAAYILPWIFCVVVYDNICEKVSDISKHKKQDIRKIRYIVYLSLIMIGSFYSIGNRIKLSNMAYTKAYANYEAGISYANRIVTRIESIDGYIPGKTKVIFAGKISGNHHQNAFEAIGDLTGIGSNFLNGYWDSALPGLFALEVLINQQLAVEMDIIAPNNNNEISYMNEETVEEILIEVDESFKNISYDINCLDAYSADNYYILKNDILIYKLS